MVRKKPKVKIAASATRAFCVVKNQSNGSARFNKT